MGEIRPRLSSIDRRRFLGGLAGGVLAAITDLPTHSQESYPQEATFYFEDKANHGFEPITITQGSDDSVLIETKWVSHKDIYLLGVGVGEICDGSMKFAMVGEYVTPYDISLVVEVNEADCIDRLRKNPPSGLIFEQ